MTELGGAGGALRVDPDALRRLEWGLAELGGTLGDAVGAVDSLPLGAVAPVLGPVGAEFVAALVDATSRHRQVLGDVARVSVSASEVVGAARRSFESTDAATGAAVRAVESGR